MLQLMKKRRTYENTGNQVNNNTHREIRRKIREEQLMPKNLHKLLKELTKKHRKETQFCGFTHRTRHMNKKKKIICKLYLEV